MSEQNTTPADAGGNTGAVDTSQSDDGFHDLDATASDRQDVQPGDDGIYDLDAEPAAAEGEGEGGNANEKKAEGADGEKKPEGDEAKTEEQKRLSGAQRAKLQRQRMLDEIAERDKRIAELEAANSKTQADDASAPKPPKEEDFNGDWFAYQRALTAFEAGETARKAAAEVLKSREDGQAAERAQRQARERLDAHMDRVEAAREVIADFDKVMESMKGVNVRNGVIEEIMSSDKSELVAYHFAQHPEELEALNSMSPRDLAKTIGRLEATLKLPEPKKTTTAPAPLSKPKGGAQMTRSPDADLSSWLDKTYGKDRKK